MGLGIHRVAHELTRWAPDTVEIVTDENDADLRIWHVLGDGERIPLLTYEKPYAVVQYCLRTSEKPHTEDWADIWVGARLVWSYYDLAEKCAEDNVTAPSNFYHAPLGVDSTVFRPRLQAGDPRKLVGTSGYIASTESVGEWVAARHTLNPWPWQFHLGPRLAVFKSDPKVLCASGLSDEALAAAWSSCQYVSCLRRIEGFELPGVEGLCCGARPVCFDQPHYRDHYGEHAEYIKERSPEEVTADLLALIKGPCRAVSPAESVEARRKFAWEPIIKGFWERLGV